MIFDYLSKLQSRGFFPKNVLDIGANVGNFSLQCKQLWPIFTNFYLIEPNEECKFNLSMTRFNVFMELLGDEDGKEVIFYKTRDFVKGTGNSMYKENTVHYTPGHVIEEKRKLTTLDTLFKDKNVKFDFAKLDTQGSELDILKGGNKTLSTCKYILIEVSLKHYNEGIPLKDDIIEYMKSIGFVNYEVIESHVWDQVKGVADINFGDVFQEDIIFTK